MEICLGSTGWPPSRASNTKWLSLAALSGKRGSEVSHVLGGGPRQRGPCNTQLETWPWDRVLEESALTVPCPAVCSYRGCAGNQQFCSVHLLLRGCSDLLLLTDPIIIPGPWNCPCCIIHLFCKVILHIHHEELSPRCLLICGCF